MSLQKTVNKHIERQERLLEDFRNLPEYPTFEDAYNFRVSDLRYNAKSIGELDMFFPYKEEDIQHKEEIMLEYGWEVCHRGTSRGEADLVFEHPDSPIRIEMYWKPDTENSNRGATCRKVKIGEEPYEGTRDIYEIVCSEGAEEEAL